MARRSPSGKRKKSYRSRNLNFNRNRPDYIKSQARERLHFVMPGERQYIVTGADGENSDEEAATDVVKNLPEGQPWYTRMIASITEAGKQ